MKPFIKKILSSMIEANQEIRNQFPEIRKEIEYAYYLKEFCTLKLDVGRRTGKTQYIIDNGNAASCVVVRNQDWAGTLYNARAGTTTDSGLMVITFNQLITSPKGKYITYNTIYVDEPYMTLPNSKDRYKFYERIANPTLDQTIIMLGQ